MYIVRLCRQRFSPMSDIAAFTALPEEDRIRLLEMARRKQDFLPIFSYFVTTPFRPFWTHATHAFFPLGIVIPGIVLFGIGVSMSSILCWAVGLHASPMCLYTTRTILGVARLVKKEAKAAARAPNRASVQGGETRSQPIVAAQQMLVAAQHRQRGSLGNHHQGKTAPYFLGGDLCSHWSLMVRSSIAKTLMRITPTQPCTPYP